MSRLVSVIIPAYNAERYIAGTITSVLTQTYDCLEIIVIDDGSSDGTADLVDGFQDPRVSRIRQKNSGLPMARNRGIEAAHGKFLAFLDSDDLWEEDKLEKQLPLFDNPDIGCVYSRSIYIDENGTVIGPYRSRLHKGRILLPLIENNFITVSSTVLSASLLQEHGLRFRTDRLPAEDWHLWLRLALLCQFDYVDEPLVSYRIHAEAMSRDGDSMYKGSMAALDDFGKVLEDSEKCNPSEHTRLLKACRRSRGIETLSYGHWLLDKGRTAEAAQIMRQAFRLTPWNIHIWWGMLKAGVR